MINDEKQEYPEYKTLGGYLRIYKTVSDAYKDCFIEAFKKASAEGIKQLLAIPNFDYSIFEDISGISETMIQEKLKKGGRG